MFKIMFNPTFNLIFFCSFSKIVFHFRFSRQKGSILVKPEELDSSKDTVIMQFNGRKLDKKDFFGKSDPFLVFARCNEDNRYDTSRHSLFV